MAKQDTVTETVDKQPNQSGKFVRYFNQFVPDVKHVMPKEEWDRHSGQGTLTNAVFIEEFEK